MSLCMTYKHNRIYTFQTRTNIYFHLYYVEDNLQMEHQMNKRRNNVGIKNSENSDLVLKQDKLWC
jgi:hypothetical protein